MSSLSKCLFLPILHLHIGISVHTVILLDVFHLDESAAAQKGTFPCVTKRLWNRSKITVPSSGNKKCSFRKPCICSSEWPEDVPRFEGKSLLYVWSRVDEAKNKHGAAPCGEM